MVHARLNDAAIALYQVLQQAGIKHGIFGGFTVASLVGPRESKDVDCIASVSKEQIIKSSMAAMASFSLIRVVRILSHSYGRTSRIGVKLYWWRFLLNDSQVHACHLLQLHRS
jgi:hypothetical protein